VNGVDVTDQGLEVPAGGDIADVIVELTDVVTELAGTVVTTGSGRSRNSIVLFPQDPNLCGFASRYVVLTGADRDNHYRVRLVPGSYCAVAIADLDRTEWNTPEFLAEVRERAVKFSISEGESKMLDLNLQQAP